MIRLSLISTYNTCKLSVIGSKLKFRLYCFAQHRGKQVLGKPKDLHGKKDRRIYPSERSTTSPLTSPVFETVNSEVITESDRPLGLWWVPSFIEKTISQKQ